MTAKWYNKKDRIVSKIIISGSLKNVSPLVIGNGKDDAADTELIKLPDGSAYIPSSSLSGKLRCIFDYLRSKKIKKIKDTDFFQFWGGTYSDGNSEKTFQSHINIEDLFGSNNAHLVALKDGVKINPEKGTAEAGSKYDYEVLEPGKIFPFKAEVTVRSQNDLEAFTEIAQNLVSILQDGIRIGALTQTGHGKLLGENFKIYKFDFPLHARQWFNYLENNTLPEELKKESSSTFGFKGKYLAKIIATFSLDGPLISATYGVDPDQPDKVMAHRKNRISQKVLSGKSIKGALRTRASKILYTIEQDDKKVEYLLEEIFGGVDTKDKKRARKSILMVEEAVFDKVKVFPQTRIRVDRFTGGTIDTALMETNPVMATEEGILKIEFSLTESGKHPNFMVSLLLMLLKDLWTGDLPIGGEKGIGRGRLRGESAKVEIASKSFELFNERGKLTITDPHDLIKTFNSLEIPNL